MMFGLSSFNLINEFERASNKPNAEQLASSLVRLQPYIFLTLITIKSDKEINESEPYPQAQTWNGSTNSQSRNNGTSLDHCCERLIGLLK